MRLLVFGGRTFGEVPRSRAERSWLPPEVIALRQQQRTMMFGKLMAIHLKHGISLIIQGQAPGADTVAGMFAFQHGIPQWAFPADWSTYKRRAGPIRNQQMIDEGKPDRGLGFPGSHGTADMARRLRKAGVPYNLINEAGDWL